MYDVDYFIKKFEAIPEDKWIMGSFFFRSRSCALGHCGMRSDSSASLESIGLLKLASSHSLKITRINDACDDNYKQPTPKQRILAALHDIKKKQSTEWVDKTIASISEPEVNSSVATVAQ